MSKNILILSAGRRVELVKCFQETAKKMCIESKVVAADMSVTAPALYFADVDYTIPPINSNQYISKIIEICNMEDISVVIPTIDTELLILSTNKEKIEKNTRAKVLISSLEVVSICRDKIKTYYYFKNHQFKCPELIDTNACDVEKIAYPLFIKPLNGSSSINAFKVNNAEELLFFEKYIDQPMVQKFIEGREYTVDVFCDWKGNVIDITPRIRCAMRSGEILQGIIDKDEEIITSVKKLMEDLKPVGHITVQCMKTKAGIEYIEINPRFGGGAPMSIKAGANSCEFIYRILLNEQLNYENRATDNLYFSRFDDAIVIKDRVELV